MQNNWIIYGATTVTGKKVLSEALRLGYRPILGGQDGQELVELAFQTGLSCRIFQLNDLKKIQTFLDDIELVAFCGDVRKREHKRLLKSCLNSKTHYIDMTNDLFAFDRVLRLSGKMQEAGITAVPGLHPSVILGDFVAATLKSHVTDASLLTLACSEAFTSASSIVNNLLRGGRILEEGKLRRPPSPAETQLIPFNGGSMLTVASAQADILAAWQATRIPNITVYRKTGEREVRFLRMFYWFRWLLHFPFIKTWVRSQDNFLIRHLGIKPFYPTRYAVWGKAANSEGRSMTLRLEIVNDFDIANDVSFALIAKLLAGPMRRGVLTPSQILGSDYWTQSEHLSLTVL